MSDASSPFGPPLGKPAPHEPDDTIEPGPVPIAARVNAVTPALLAFMVAGGFLGLTAAVLFRAVAESATVSMMLGSLGAGFTMVLGFYFGSTSSSRSKDAAIGTLVADAAAMRRS